MLSTIQDKDLVKYMLGQTVSIHPPLLTPTVLEAIVEGAIIRHLSLNHIRGLKSIPQILCERGNHIVGKYEPEDYRKALYAATLSTRDIFLECLSIKPFPEWSEWPTTRHAHSVWSTLIEDVKIPFVENILLLARKKDGHEFYILSVEWIPHEEWDENEITPWLSSCWVRAKRIEFKRVEHLRTIFEDTESGQKIAARLLHALFLAQAETSNDLESRWKSSELSRIALEKLIHRLPIAFL